MNKKMREIMETSWRDWHGNTDEDDIPSVNLSYEKGFNAACEKLMPLLIESALHVMASHGADHMLDGFRPQRRPIDDLVDAINEVIE